MKKCAKCDFEYDDAYDGCPVCARAALPPSVPTVAGPVPGSVGGALLALLGYFFLVGVFAALSGNVSVGAVITLLVFAAIVTADASQLHKPAPVGFKAEGMTGTHPFVWGLAVLLIAILAIPIYFYERPRIARAYSTATAVTVNRTAAPAVPSAGAEREQPPTLY